MRYLPVGLDIRNRACTVVGGGTVGTRKVGTLLDAGAHVTVVSPKVTPELAGLIEEGRVRWIQDRFQGKHLAGVFLVVLATDDPAMNAAAVRLATQQGVLACDASSARHSQVIFGALLESAGVTIATFTDGRSPTRARETRDRIARLLEDDEAERVPAPDSILVLVARGGRDRQWNVPLEALMEQLQAEVGGCKVQLAYTRYTSPSLEEVVTTAAREGVRRICVLPLFMTEEGHVKRDLRPMVDKLRQAHPGREIVMLPPVGQHHAFEKVLVEIAREATV